MKITIDGIGEIKFSFQHREDKSGSICRADINGSPYFESSCLAPGDQFRKDKGRRVSLSRWLKREWAGLPRFTREQRRAIWAEYFRTHADLRK